MASNPVVWFEIYVQDMARARAFYESVFKTELKQLADPTGQLEMWAFPLDMEKYGISGALTRMAGVASGGNSTLVYFHAEDCAVEQARVEPAGGQVCRPKFSIGEYGHCSLVADTEGNMIGLHSMD